ncbi:MAG: hypothetical protein ACTFAL_00080 [Candidatus Electronema sp. V4]|uniref:hypothetical protein n=1 Tax=Candidatus Electronema sp. V4 TaxID=3454756 RepID=UPI0040555603
MPHFNAQRGKWMAQVVVNGCKLRRQFDTKAEARRWEIEKKDALERPARPPGLLFTLGSWSEAYLVFAQGKFSYKTVSEKRLAFRLLFMSVPSATPAADLRKGDALAHFAAQARARSGNAANKDRKNLVAAWNWAAEYLPDFPARNPFLTELFPEERSARQVPTENEFWAVHAAAESEQDRAMLLCFSISPRAGMRYSASASRMLTLTGSASGCTPASARTAPSTMTGCPCPTACERPWPGIFLLFRRMGLSESSDRAAVFRAQQMAA